MIRIIHKQTIVTEIVEVFVALKSKPIVQRGPAQLRSLRAESELLVLSAAQTGAMMIGDAECDVDNKAST
jgi:hypothetical protein